MHRVVAVHAAMAGGTGLSRFEKRFSERCFDVGIAEQHAVTFAAGLACEGLVPFATIYSTFLQRGYDQVVHDVALQKLPGGCRLLPVAGHLAPCWIVLGWTVLLCSTSHHPVLTTCTLLLFLLPC